VIAGDDGARARALVLEYGWNATAYQILNPGITLWFSRDGDAAVGFVSCAGTRVVAGAPVCRPDRLPEVIEEFSAASAAVGERVCYFGAGARLEQLLVPTGRWSAASLGAQPSWDPRGWPSIVARRASLRAQLNRARNKGVAVTEWDTDRARDSSDLRRCLAEWLAERRLPPLHFLVEPDTLGRLEDRRVFVATHGSAVVGFLLASPVPARAGWLVEQIIRGRHAPNGTTELMLDAAMRSLAASGARYVTLGLAPLSHHSHFDRRRMPLWLQLGLAWVRAHGRRFYNFEGLDRFKAKFEPESWEEIVALSDSPRFPVRSIWAIAAAFSRGSPVALVARAAGRAVVHEVARLTR
jgi:phosphatidylglycerol lysyltransferase